MGLMARLKLVEPLISEPTREQIGAEFLDLDRQLQDFAPTVRRHKILQEMIRGWYADWPADQPAVFEGSNYRIHVGARSAERYFDLKTRIKIFAKLGKARAMELFSITLKAVEDNLGNPEFEALVSKSFTGSRKLVAVQKAPATKAA